MAVTENYQIQIGREATWGTPVTPTAKLMGVDLIPTMNPGYQATVREDARGSVAPGYLVTIDGQTGGSVTLNGNLSYEDVAYYLDGLFSQATPTGAGPYTRQYAAPLTSAALTPRILTIMYGDAAATAVYQASGGTLTSLTISGENNAPWRFSAAYGLRQVISGSFAALTDRVVNLIMGHHGSVFIDSFGGTMGTTAVSNTAYAFELSVTPTRVMKTYFGALGPAAWEGNTWTGSLRLSMEVNATSKAIVDAILVASPTAPVSRLIRIAAADPASPSGRTLTLNFAGVVTSPPALFSNRSGVTTFDITFNGLVDTGAFGNWLTATSINGVAVLA